MVSSRSSTGRGEDAVTAVVATISILAVSIAGIGITMAFGAPVLDRVHTQADANNVVGQFDNLRYEERRLALPGTSVGVGLNVAEGSLAVVDGTLLFLTVFHEDTAFASHPGEPCDLSLSGWLDGDHLINFDFTGASTTSSSDDLCRQPYFDGYMTSCERIDNPDWAPGNGQDKKIDVCTTTPKQECGGSHDDRMCVEIYDAEGLVGYSDATTCGGTNSPGNPDHPGNTPSARCDEGVFGANVTLDTDQDWLIQFTNGRTGSDRIVFVEAFLVHMERLEWDGGDAEVVYESGAVFARDGDDVYLVSSPAVTEGPAGDLAVRLATWQGSTSGSVAPGIPSTLQVGYDQAEFLGASSAASVTRVRLDFSGDLAQGWCNTFLQRNNVLTEDWYWEGGRATCATPASDATRGLFYDPDGPGDDTFGLSILQQVLHARFRP